VKILIVHRGVIPVFAYGGTERVIWGLGKALTQMGHQVTYLVHAGSSCPFAQVITLPEGGDWRALVPRDTDVVHMQYSEGSGFQLHKPMLVTQHGNSEVGAPLPRNTVFLSANHAARHQAQCYVHNGLDWSEYGQMQPVARGPAFHFLGKAAWRVKNVQGAIDVALAAGVPLVVMGGYRVNLKRGLRITLSRRVSFMGMVGGQNKLNTLRQSRGLIFPVRWHEPFGLAVIESLYFGAPVFATPYGALPELVPPDCGVLSTDGNELADAVRARSFDPQACHRFASGFSAESMAQRYLGVYERVISGECLNDREPVMRDPASALDWQRPGRYNHVER